MTSSRTPQTSLTLIHRLQGDSQAEDWVEFQAFYWDVVTGWARDRGCPPEIAEDIYQDTMVSLLRYLPKYQPEKARFRAFLKTITVRRIEDYWRRHYRGPRDAEVRSRESYRPLQIDLDELPDSEDRTPSDDERVWLASITREALRRTQNRSHDLTYKSFCSNLLEGKSVDTISTELGIDRDSIYRHKDRCLQRLVEDMVEVLRELSDQFLEQFAADSTGARDTMLAALKEYLAGRLDLRATEMAPDDSQEAILESVAELGCVLRDTPPPSDSGTWMWVTEQGDRRWVEVTSGMTIGRKAACTLCLASPLVSGLHASIHLDDTGWTIKDEHSTHGILVNGEKVPEWQLRSGTQFQLGNALFLILTD